MAILTGTATTFTGSPGIQGQREDLSDEIYMVSPEVTPFMSNVGRGECNATLHEWQTDKLAAANVNNAQFQGDDIATFSAASVTTRLGNRTQISRKEVILSGTLQAVNLAGRRKELALQMSKRMKELKIDIESILLNNQAKVTGAAATAPKLAGVPAWIVTNVDKEATGTNPAGDGSNARGDSAAPRALTEAMVQNVSASIFNNSSEPLDVLMVGTHNKQVASGFTGGAQKTVDVMKKEVVATIDVWVGDFHTVRVIANRWQRSRDALLLNWSYWSVDWLRPIAQETLAKTGDADKRMLIGEYTLTAKNEAANGIIADLL